MTPLRLRTLLLIAALTCCAGGMMMALAEHLGLPYTPILPATFLLVCCILACILVWLGFQVAKFSDRNRRVAAKAMSPLLAARVAVLAQATAMTGSALAGWHLPFFVSCLSLISVRGFTSSFWVALADVAGGILLVLVGYWVENMCKIPPSDPEDDVPGANTPRENPGYAVRQGKFNKR